MGFIDYADKKSKKIGVTSNQYDYWSAAKQGYMENYKVNFKTPTKLLQKDLKEMEYGRPMYSADMGYERGKKEAIKKILWWRNKNKK